MDARYCAFRSLPSSYIEASCRGNHIDFTNTVIVLTSNVGADVLASLEPGLPSEAARPLIMERIRQTFSPEFINR